MEAYAAHVAREVRCPNTDSVQADLEQMLMQTTLDHDTGWNGGRYYVLTLRAIHNWLIHFRKIYCGSPSDSAHHLRTWNCKRRIAGGL